MKRLALLIGMICSVVISLQAQHSHRKNYDESKYGALKGNVHSLQYMDYDAKIYFGDIRMGEVNCHEYFKFDIVGNVVEDEVYNFDGTLLGKQVYDYDSLLNVSEAVWYISDGLLLWKVIYKYDSLGRETEMATYTSTGSLHWKYVYKYAPDGSEKESAWYDFDGTLKQKTIYKYDSVGNEIEKSEYKSDGLLYERHTFQYDLDGNKVENAVYKSDGSLWEKHTYKHDSGGNVIEIESDHDSDSSGLLKRKYIYKYDAVGNVIEEATYDSKGSLINICYYEYTYDSKNNYTKKITYRGEARIPIYVTTRKIKYFFEEEDFIDDIIICESDEIEEEPAFVKVEVMPSFMGGDLNTFRTWFSGEFKIPAEAAKNGIQGRVVVKFVVEKDGSIGGIDFLQSPDKVYEDEARRVLMKSPRWTPGRQRDQVVRVFYILPIDCRLQ